MLVGCCRRSLFAAPALSGRRSQGPISARRGFMIYLLYPCRRSLHFVVRVHPPRIEDFRRMISREGDSLKGDAMEASLGRTTNSQPRLTLLTSRYCRFRSPVAGCGVQCCTGMIPPAPHSRCDLHRTLSPFLFCWPESAAKRFTTAPTRRINLTESVGHGSARYSPSLFPRICRSSGVERDLSGSLFHVGHQWSERGGVWKCGLIEEYGWRPKHCISNAQARRKERLYCMCPERLSPSSPAPINLGRLSRALA